MTPLPSARIDELLAAGRGVVNWLLGTRLVGHEVRAVQAAETVKAMIDALSLPPVKVPAETASPRPDEGKAEPVAWPADDTALAQMCEDFQTGSVAFANEPEEFHHLIEFTPPMLREFVARHPPYASPLPVEAGEPVGLPQDVIDLVIEARNVAYSDQSPEAIRALDKAVEAFAERVGWEDDPTPLEAEDRP